MKNTGDGSNVRQQGHPHHQQECLVIEQGADHIIVFESALLNLRNGGIICRFKEDITDYLT